MAICILCMCITVWTCGEGAGSLLMNVMLPVCTAKTSVYIVNILGVGRSCLCLCDSTGLPGLGQNSANLHQLYAAAASFLLAVS